MKLAIGTAQFGLDYGVSNKNGKTSLNELTNIFKVASENNINYIDTAYCYGDAEQRLSKFITNNFNVITKILKPNEIPLSFSNLKREPLYGVMFHNTDILIDNIHYWKELKEYKKRGLINKIGVSVYSQEQIFKLLNFIDIDIIQLPINVLDQKFLSSNTLLELKKKNIEIHARSVFLQGLLLMDINKMNPCFNSLKPILIDYFNFLENHGLSKLQGAINFVKNIKEVDKIVVGVNNANQLNQIIEAYHFNENINYNEFMNINSRLLNPSNWELQ